MKTRFLADGPYARGVGGWPDRVPAAQVRRRCDGATQESARTASIATMAKQCAAVRHGRAVRSGQGVQGRRLRADPGLLRHRRAVHRWTGLREDHACVACWKTDANEVPERRQVHVGQVPEPHGVHARRSGAPTTRIASTTSARRAAAVSSQPNPPKCNLETIHFGFDQYIAGRHGQGPPAEELRLSAERRHAIRPACRATPTRAAPRSTTSRSPMIARKRSSLSTLAAWAWIRRRLHKVPKGSLDASRATNEASWAPGPTRGAAMAMRFLALAALLGAPGCFLGHDEVRRRHHARPDQGSGRPRGQARSNRSISA